MDVSLLCTVIGRHKCKLLSFCKPPCLSVCLCLQHCPICVFLYWYIPCSKLILFIFAQCSFIQFINKSCQQEWSSWIRNTDPTSHKCTKFTKRWWKSNVFKVKTHEDCVCLHRFVYYVYLLIIIVIVVVNNEILYFSLIHVIFSSIATFVKNHSQGNEIWSQWLDLSLFIECFSDSFFSFY